jgi:hypothetical protein
MDLAAPFREFFLDMDADQTTPEPEVLAAEPLPERRSEPRYQFTASVELVEIKTGLKAKARVSDLGRGGCYIDINSPSPLGTALKIKISKETKSFEAQGKVTYSLPGMGMGLMFTKVDPKQTKTLERWIGEITGDTVPDDEEPDPEPEPQQAAASPASAASEQSFVLHELLIALMRKGILSETEGKTMLQKLLR